MMRDSSQRSGFKPYGYLGLAIMVLSEVMMSLGVEPFHTLHTPMSWSGLILFVDALIFRLRGESMIASRTREFLLLLPISLGLWLVFEFYNLFLQNWRYVDLPESRLYRYFGYAWSFATIWPAIFEVAELVRSIGLYEKAKTSPLVPSRAGISMSVALGFTFLLIPVVFPTRYWAVLVWTGFVFFLDPINYLAGGASFLRDLQRGDPRRLLDLVTSGLICGILWEFWNYWAGARWVYSVPILGHIKVFEMPVIGYLGFMPFALECLVMYTTLTLLLQRLFRLECSLLRERTSPGQV
jgi:hypothetical protein